MRVCTSAWFDGERFFYIESNDPKTNAKGGTEAGLYEMLQEYMIENESLR